MDVYGHIISHIFQTFSKGKYLIQLLLNCGCLIQNSKKNGMENITTEEVMHELDMFQARFGKVDEFGWWYMEIIQTNAVK